MEFIEKVTDELMNFFRVGVLFWLAVLCTTVSADVYRSVDAEGNVTYSDQPHEGAEKLDVKPPTIIPSTPNQIKSAADKTAKQAVPYTTVEIVAPANEETLRNVQSVSVSGQLIPGLQTAFGHRVQILFDGSPIREPGTALRATLNEVERGAHTLQLVVLDRQGTAVARSPVSQFFLHKNFVRPGN